MLALSLPMELPFARPCIFVGYGFLACICENYSFFFFLAKLHFSRSIPSNSTKPVQPVSTVERSVIGFILFFFSLKFILIFWFFSIIKLNWCLVPNQTGRFGLIFKTIINHNMKFFKKVVWMNVKITSRVPAKPKCLACI